MFDILDTTIGDLKIIKPKLHSDNRGFFYESYRNSEIEKIIGKKDIYFVQDNHSKSKKNVLRGLHYQIKSPQIKLIRVVSGKIFDVAVDIRKASDTFGKWFGIELNNINNFQLLIPEGFAHGYLTLSDEAEVVYKVTKYYDPEYERCIKWDDKQININWQSSIDPIISEKDYNGLSLQEAEIF